MAVRLGFGAAAHELLDAGADPNKTNAKGLLPVHLAAALACSPDGDSNPILPRLLSAGAGNPMGPAVHEDLRRGLSKQEKLMLSLDDIMSFGFADACDPKSVTAVPASMADILGQASAEGFSALHYACGANLGEGESAEPGDADARVENLEAMLAACGGDSSILDQRSAAGGLTPLLLLVKTGVERGMAESQVAGLVTKLLAAGCDADAVLEEADGSKSSSLHLAVQSGHEEVAAALLASGASASPPACDVPPVFLACKIGASGSLVRSLVEADAEGSVNQSIAVPGYDGTALHVAGLADNAEAVDVLLSAAGVDVAAADSKGMTPLCAVCAAPRPGCAAAAKVLLTTRPAPSVLEPLRLAVAANSPGTVEALLAAQGEDEAEAVGMAIDGEIYASAKAANVALFEATDFTDPLIFDKSDDLVASNSMVKMLAALANGGVEAETPLPSDVKDAEVATARRASMMATAAISIQCMARKRKARLIVSAKRRTQSRGGKRKKH